jgi:hypothetical protein
MVGALLFVPRAPAQPPDTVASAEPAFGKVAQDWKHSSVHRVSRNAVTGCLNGYEAAASLSTPFVEPVLANHRYGLYRS